MRQIDTRLETFKFLSLPGGYAHQLFTLVAVPIRVITVASRTPTDYRSLVYMYMHSGGVVSLAISLAG